ncbi:hypothetical protein BDV37DRAFT_272647 [Aspergillus pseudonomiae]|uniref:Uncharacterized protein n=1 Tax=Aspergillus pseudonomiae TaxID=1506151 RepID=A0A5N7D9W7_9EURO|nr:uncharacterized protein BDV37DRAFT_272647 [Aspergillus pseudonomiae]KAE8402793.1 hypothetical protein BDV37DRAFT_272647 [Aspergillus pseudonomiae]
MDDDNDDAVQPTKETFDRVLRESYALWSSYVDLEGSTSLPIQCIDLKGMLGQTPSFLGHGLIFENEPAPFKCTESSGGLYVNGHSTWKTSNGDCQLGPKEIHPKLLLATPTAMNVELSDSAPFAEWPGVQSLEEYDEGNYIAVLFLAWAYILSARWSELLSKSPEHRCMIALKEEDPRCEVPLSHSRIEVDIGVDASDDEVHWWNVILSVYEGWSITTVYNGRTYVSPWASSSAKRQQPSSDRAVEYLARFCCYKRLYGQCSAALSAALCIPFVWTKSISLPVPKMSATSGCALELHCSPATHIYEHCDFLPRYMMLSCNTWGIRSLLHATFFNPDIECNLVAAWMSAVFVVIGPATQERNIVKFLKILARRLPKLAPLWLGAMLLDEFKALKPIKAGCVAVELHAAAWTDTIDSFITQSPGISDGRVIRREDECRLLHIIGCGFHGRLPVWPWKPFGETLLKDAEPEVQKHIQCNCHCLEYWAWYWELVDGKELEARGADAHQPGDNSTQIEPVPKRTPSQWSIDCLSDDLSAGTTRGIFGWLRSTGYPANERHVYKHPWFDVGDCDEDEMSDDREDGGEVNEADRRKAVESWLEKSV